MFTHRETILDCLEIFGRERTRDMFYLTKDDTLEQFIKSNGRPPTQKLTRLERAELNAKEALDLARKLEKQMELVNSRLSIVDEGQRKIGVKQNEMAGQVNNFEARVANELGSIFTQALGQGLGKLVAPAKEMLPQPPSLRIASLVDEQHSKAQAKKEAKEKAKREAGEARRAEAIARKEARLATKKEAKREAQEAKKRAKREAETKAKEATLVAQGQTHDILVKGNPLATTIARLKGE